MAGWKEQSIFLSICLIVTVAAAFIAGWTRLGFTRADQVTFGVTLSSAFLLIDVLILVRTGAVTRQKELAQWRKEEELDGILTAIRNDFSQVVKRRHGEDDLFVAHYTREITGLAGDIRKSAELEELWVGNHHFGSVDKVMNAFLGEAKPLHRNVWIMEPSERLFEAHSADVEYFGLLAKAANSRRFGGVRTLCVVNLDEHLEDPRIKGFLDFYAKQPRFDCRGILADEYKQACTDAQLSEEFIDFGIYGTRQMFLTKVYEPERKGVFVRNKSEVRKYTRFFDTRWNSQTSKPNPSDATERMTLEQLLTIDGQVSCEKI